MTSVLNFHYGRSSFLVVLVPVRANGLWGSSYDRSLMSDLRVLPSKKGCIFNRARVLKIKSL